VVTPRYKGTRGGGASEETPEFLLIFSVPSGGGYASLCNA
jgi:hypothetical protein